MRTFVVAKSCCPYEYYKSLYFSYRYFLKMRIIHNSNCYYSEKNRKLCIKYGRI